MDSSPIQSSTNRTVGRSAPRTPSFIPRHETHLYHRNHHGSTTAEQPPTRRLLCSRHQQRRCCRLSRSALRSVAVVEECLRWVALDAKPPRRWRSQTARGRGTRRLVVIACQADGQRACGLGEDRFRYYVGRGHQYAENIATVSGPKPGRQIPINCKTKKI